MHIFVNNKKLFTDQYNVKCSIGKRGIGTKIREGDQITPRGKYRIKSILYRKDRILNLNTKMSKIIIQKNMGWCDDPKSQSYNKLIKFPFNLSAEKLYRIDNIYDIILVLDFNTNPILKNKGSAIFIHIAKKKYEKTKGCIAISKINLRKLIGMIDKKTIVNID